MPCIGRLLIAFYNLDMVISVGYRVKSLRGTQFRIWATQILKVHIIKGYTTNELRLQDLNKAVRLIADVAQRRFLEGREATALLQMVGENSFALDILDDYDHEKIPPPPEKPVEARPIFPEEARRIVAPMRRHFGPGDLFGLEKDRSLESSLATVKTKRTP